MNLGPFHFTGDVSLGSLVTVLGIIWASIKYLRHIVADIQTRNERLDKMWVKFNGKKEDGSDGWFNRLDVMEFRVNQIWGRLQFNRLSINELKTRDTDS